MGSSSTMGEQIRQGNNRWMREWVELPAFLEASWHLYWRPRSGAVATATSRTARRRWRSCSPADDPDEMLQYSDKQQHTAHNTPAGYTSHACSAVPIATARDQIDDVFIQIPRARRCPRSAWARTPNELRAGRKFPQVQWSRTKRQAYASHFVNWIQVEFSVRLLWSLWSTTSGFATILATASSTNGAWCSGGAMSKPFLQSIAPQVGTN